MYEKRIVRRLNAIIVLLLVIIGLLSYDYVAEVVPIGIPLAAMVLVPVGLLVVVWGLARASLAVEAS